MGEVVVGFFEHHRIGFACGDAWKKNKNVPQMVVKNADLPWLNKSKVQGVQVSAFGDSFWMLWD